jgi:large subunit ribosomal protein L25
MSTARIDLKVFPRKTGKSTSRELRTLRKVPGVVYGALKQNFNIFVDENALLKLQNRGAENALINLQQEEGQGEQVVALLKDMAVHPVTRKPLHVDFFALDLKKPVRIFLEVKVEGKPAGLAEGGVLNVVNRSIEIECLPTAIPDALVLDVSALKLNESIHVGDLKLPEGVKLISSKELTIAVVNVQEEEKVVTPTAEAVAAPAAPAAPTGDAKATAGKAAPAKDDKKK